ncbi:ferric reductase like transmembrane component-domain-containing protein [Tricharina praecox]|uniref:ferric reductase like transmembrane component-domain-containing protein n=1 Tax=Tricharina praecox TaxID=43433 RepID=UPI00221E3FC6|nr:ferric reductase like transmembrane component-domain-containing protein [Tricharina praecox]KAI5853542.1 ferric reductase like transmembrane component-domain-containing protein [Tricharina praecox]
MVLTTMITAVVSCTSYSQDIYVPNPLFTTTTSQYLRYSANRTGVLSFALLPALVLSAARKNILAHATGWSLDSWNVFHRFLGRLAAVLTAVHTVLFCAYIVERGERFAPQWRLQYWWGGVAAGVGMLWLAGPPSVRWARRRSYEVFLWGHVLATLVVVYTCAVHVFWVLSVEWLWAAAGLWLLDRGLRLWLGVGGGECEGIAQTRGDVVRLQVTVPAKSVGDARPGLFFHLRFPGLRWGESHPFSVAHVKRLGDSVTSVASSEATSLLPTSGGKHNGRLQLTFIIRPYSGMTKALHAYAATPSTGSALSVGVEGPYYHHIPLPPRTLFLAAGVGIALVLPYLRAEPQEAHWVLGRSEDLWALQSVLEETPNRGLEGLRVWLTFRGRPEMQILRELARVGARVVWERLPIRDAVEAWVGVGASGEGKTRLAVMACGPERFLDACRSTVGAFEGVEYWEEVSTK